MKIEYTRNYKFIIDTDKFPNDWQFDGTLAHAEDILNEFFLDDLFADCEKYKIKEEVKPL